MKAAKLKKEYNSIIKEYNTIVNELEQLGINI